MLDRAWALRPSGHQAGVVGLSLLIHLIVFAALNEWVRVRPVEAPPSSITIDIVRLELEAVPEAVEANPDPINEVTDPLPSEVLAETLFSGSPEDNEEEEEQEVRFQAFLSDAMCVPASRMTPVDEALGRSPCPDSKNEPSEFVKAESDRIAAVMAGEGQGGAIDGRDFHGSYEAQMDLSRLGIDNAPEMDVFGDWPWSSGRYP